MATIELEAKKEKRRMYPCSCPSTLEELKESIRKSEEDIKNGRVIDNDEVFERIERLIAE